MKTKTEIMKRKKECRHSVVFEPVNSNPNEPSICSGVYISRAVLAQMGASDTSSIKLCLAVPDDIQNDKVFAEFVG